MCSIGQITKAWDVPAMAPHVKTRRKSDCGCGEVGSVFAASVGTTSSPTGSIEVGLPPSSCDDDDNGG